MSTGFNRDFLVELLFHIKFMSAVLYRKYRPANFDEIVGQEHIVKTLSNSIKNGMIAHAYLFSGPRGTGKTSMARIFAKTINCVNTKDGNSCNECRTCLEMNGNKFFDLVEIDAATYTKVESMRDVIEKINFAPSSGKYRVYIIDEVHMLSKSASNALLKTLEEPPQHAVFVLATTEAYKIPATIISRCQKFDFRRLKVSEIKEKLKEIAKKEKANVEDSVFDFIAMNSNGGLRDSQSLLGQILSIGEGDITLKDVQNILAITDISKAIDLIELIAGKKYGEAIIYINKINDDGYDSEQFAKSVVEYARKLILIKVSPQMKEKFSSEMTEEQIDKVEDISGRLSISQIVKIIRSFISAKEEIRSSILPQLPLEMAIADINISDGGILTDSASGHYNEKIESKIENNGIKATPVPEKKVGVILSVSKLQNFVKEGINLKKEEAVKELKGEDENSSSAPSAIEVGDGGKIDFEVFKSEWREILEELKLHNHSLTAILKTCQPVGMENDYVVVSCKYSFHKDKLHKVSNRIIIEKVASGILKTNVLMKFISEEDANRMGYKIEEVQAAKESEDLVDSALEMFGGEVVG